MTKAVKTYNLLFVDYNDVTRTIRCKSYAAAEKLYHQYMRDYNLVTIREYVSECCSPNQEGK